MKFISIKQAANLVGAHPMTIRRILAKGNIKKYSIERKIMIDEEEFINWLERENNNIILNNTK